MKISALFVLLTLFIFANFMLVALIIKDTDILVALTWIVDKNYHTPLFLFVAVQAVLFFCIYFILISPITNLSKHLAYVIEHNDSKTNKLSGKSMWIQEINDMTINYNELLEHIEKDKLIIAEKSQTDELTQIFNRRKFNFELEKEHSRSARYHRKYVVMMLDLAHFKNINDVYGYETGDYVLIQVSRHLMRQLRSQDILARTGGNKFSIILPETDEDSGKIIAERVINSTEQLKLIYDEDLLSVSVNIGSACYPVDCSNFNDILTTAEQRMYENDENKV